MTPTRAELEAAALQVAELERRRKAWPLAYARYWHNDPPRTSQRDALLPIMEEGVQLLAVLGGNRAGKSKLLADWLVANALGRDFCIQDKTVGAVYPVKRWMALNGYPERMIGLGPAPVWVGSPTFAAACEQIRPHIARAMPIGTKFTSWEDKASQAEAKAPNGGMVISKAYRQYDMDDQTWEGSAIRALGLDEQPNKKQNMEAGFSRLVDYGGCAMSALTHLRGPGDWFAKDIIARPPPWARVRYIWGEDNPHIPQDRLALMLSTMPAWQRAARARGEVVSPEGQCYDFRRSVHVIDPFFIPTTWTRWMGIDWGGRAPHVVWAAEGPDGTLYVYREVAPRRETHEPAIHTPKLLAMAKEQENGDESLGHCSVYRVADSEDPGSIQLAWEAGMMMEAAEKPAGSVNLGIELVNRLLQDVDPMTLEPVKPRIYVFNTCPVLIEELEGMRWADVREGQEPRPDPSCPDHGPDALRYLVQYRQRLGFR